MKKSFLLLLVILMTTITIDAQTSASDKLYAKLDGADGVTIASLSKDIINMIDMVVDDKASKQVTGPMNKVKMMICKKDHASSSVEAIMETFAKRPFDLVEDDDDAEVFIIRSGRKIKECHVVSNRNDRLFVLSFYGDFKIEDIDEMVNKADHIR